MISQNSLRNVQRPTGADVVDDAAKKAEAILAGEHRGLGDTIEAAMYRAEARWGIAFSTLFSLRYRREQLADIKGSILRRIDGAFAYVAAQQEASLRRDVKETREILGDDVANATPAVRAAEALLRSAKGEESAR